MRLQLQTQEQHPKHELRHVRGVWSRELWRGRIRVPKLPWLWAALPSPVRFVLHGGMDAGVLRGDIAIGGGNHA